MIFILHRYPDFLYEELEYAKEKSLAYCILAGHAHEPSFTVRQILHQPLISDYEFHLDADKRGPVSQQLHSGNKLLAHCRNYFVKA